MALEDDRPMGGAQPIKLRPQLHKVLVTAVARGGFNAKAHSKHPVPQSELEELETLGLVSFVRSRRGRPVWHPTRRGRELVAVEAPALPEVPHIADQVRRRQVAPPNRPTVSCSAHARDILAYWRTVGLSGFVYFVQQGEDGPIKIGQAAAPLSRVPDLQVGNPAELHLREVVLADTSTERTLQKHWRPAWIRGEWFGRGHEAEILETAGRIADYQREARVVTRADFPEITGKVMVKALFARPATSEKAA